MCLNNIKFRLIFYEIDHVCRCFIKILEGLIEMNRILNIESKLAYILLII